MISFFEMMGETFSAAVAFIGALITNVIAFITLIPYATTLMYKAVAYIPPMFSVFAVATIVICVFLAIVGRNSGGQN